MSLSIENLEKIGIIALKNAHNVHQKLGKKGESLIQKNPFGEASLRMDIEAEKAVIEIFKEKNIPIKIISEEHGEIIIGKNPVYLSILDGLDGTSVYKSARGKGRYGTMLGIFSNLNPKYKNYVFSGIIEHSTNKLFFATKNKGSFLLERGIKKSIFSSSCNELNNKTKILADIGLDKSLNITLMHDFFISKLNSFVIKDVMSSATGYADLASGVVDLVLEGTRKRNLEMASAFGLVNESGGVMITEDGISVENKLYWELGQDKHIPIISASSLKLAKKLINKVI